MALNGAGYRPIVTRVESRVDDGRERVRWRSMPMLICAQPSDVFSSAHIKKHRKRLKYR